MILCPTARPPRIALLTTYPPTQCGLATFSSALVEHLAPLPGEVGVVRVLEHAGEAGAGLAPEVVAHLVNGSRQSAQEAVATLEEFDAVLLQHEYGIFGGPDGCDVLDIVAALTVPVVAVLHTVLSEPSPRQRMILLRLLELCPAVVTMTETARRRLVEVYGADPAKLSVVPHGAPDYRARRPRTPSARPMVLTWGLLGPGKGIEWAIEAVAGLRELSPRYVVAGRTHPKVLERHGEAYRDGLRAQVDRLGAADLVEFDDGYLDAAALGALIQAADVVLLPYDSRDQVTSGVLIEAVAAGRPVVSTAFPHAVELLADGTGLLAPQGDAAALEAALRRVLSEPGLAAAMSAQAERKAPALLWGAVAARYRAIVGAQLPVAAPAA